MQPHIYQPAKPSQPLRAIVEIDGAELRVYPIGNTDADTDRILDALRYIRDEHGHDS